jgi:hypothetical protein
MSEIENFDALVQAREQAAQQAIELYQREQAIVERFTAPQRQAHAKAILEMVPEAEREAFSQRVNGKPLEEWVKEVAPYHSRPAEQKGTRVPNSGLTVDEAQNLPIEELLARRAKKG